MEILIHLYGKKESVMGWRMVLDQEKVPYVYMGTVLDSFSSVNILVGLSLKVSARKTNIVFIIEPTTSQVCDSKTHALLDSIIDDEIGEIKTYGYAVLKKLKGKYLGVFKTHKIYNDDKYPVTMIDKNRVIFQCNLSQQLNLYGYTNNLITSGVQGNMVYAQFSPVDRAGVIRFLRKVIIKAFDIAGLPYVHIWYYPTKTKSVFLFRQDVDYVDVKAMEGIYEVTKRYRVKGTYFVNIDGGEEFDRDGPIDELSEPTTPKRRLILDKLLKEGNEIANHGYLHTVESDITGNFKNIKRCSIILGQLFGVKDKGYASPGGIYNIALANAIDKSAMEYTCNGCLGSGGFPYYPYIGQREAKALEVPFHLICDGLFEPFTRKLEQNFVQKDLLVYVKRQIKNHEPVAVMGHPHLAGKIAGKFYPKILKKIKDSKISNMTIFELAKWWKKRSYLSFSYKVGIKSLEISGPKNLIVEVIVKGKRRLMQMHKNSSIMT